MKRLALVLVLIAFAPAPVVEPAQPQSETDEIEEDAGETGPFIAGAGGVTKPRRIEGVTPEFPRKALEARAEGKVYLEAVVFKDGSVGEVRVLKCTRPEWGFEQAAIKAVETWLYEPALRNGEPVDVFITIDVNFTLENPLGGPIRLVPLAQEGLPEYPAGLPAKKLDASLALNVALDPRGYVQITRTRGCKISRKGVLQSREVHDTACPLFEKSVADAAKDWIFDSSTAVDTIVVRCDWESHKRDRPCHVWAVGESPPLETVREIPTEATP